MTYKVLLRNNETKEERTHAVEGQEWDDNAEYQWLDGNYACDCNRALFFARAGGEADPDSNCGGDLFTVVKIILANGTEIVIE